ncbi:hypothetical protein [Methanosphaera sp.]|jgi:hypothetical protein
MMNKTAKNNLKKYQELLDKENNKRNPDTLKINMFETAIECFTSTIRGE